MNHIQMRRMIGIAFGDAATSIDKKHRNECKVCSRKIAHFFAATNKAVHGTKNFECKVFDSNKMALYIDGVMKENEKNKFEDHLYQCVSCLCSVKNVIEDMSVFGITRKKENEPIVDAFIRLAKNGLELVGKMVQPMPILEDAVEVRGKPKKSQTIRMKWIRKKGSSKYVIVVQYFSGQTAGLSVEITLAKEKRIKIDLLRDGSLAECKMITLQSGKGNAEFGNLGKGHYQLQVAGLQLFGFKLR